MNVTERSKRIRLIGALWHEMIACVALLLLLLVAVWSGGARAQACGALDCRACAEAAACQWCLRADARIRGDGRCVANGTRCDAGEPLRDAYAQCAELERADARRVGAILAALATATPDDNPWSAYLQLAQFDVAAQRCPRAPLLDPGPRARRAVQMASAHGSTHSQCYCSCSHCYCSCSHGYCSCSHCYDSCSPWFLLLLLQASISGRASTAECG